jgi:hypothetical protein
MREVHNSSSTLLLFNSRSVKNMWHDILYLIDTYSAEIVAIIETWLSSNLDFVAYTRRNFSKFDSHIQQLYRNEGVMCLVRQVFNAVEIVKPSNFPVTCDCLILHLRSLALVKIILYRPPLQ